MDDYSGKRAVGGFGVTGRGPGLAIRDTFNREDRSVQYCDRLVCSNRPNSMRRTQVGSSDRDKFTSSFRSTSGKAIVGSSSKAYSPVANLGKPHQGSQNSSAHKETISSENDNMHVDEEISESSSSTTSDPMGLEVIDAESGVLKEFSLETFGEAECYNLASSRRTQKKNHKRFSLGYQETPAASSTRYSFAPKNTSQAAKSASHGQGSNISKSSASTPTANRYGLRNLRCKSISDVLPPSCSSSDPSNGKRAEVMNMRSSHGECSSSRGKVVSESSSAGNSGSRGDSLSLSEHPSSQPTSRRTRYWPSSRNGVASVRTRRPFNGDTRPKFPEHGNDNSESLAEPPVQMPQVLQISSSVSDSSSYCSPEHSAPELPISGQNISVRPRSRNENVSSRPITHPEDSNAWPFNRLSMDRDSFRRFNIDGIAEVLLALERIEQDEELSYEQLLVLETNLLLGGLGLHDQHRDMRLDIDSMSYEELLALGEKMGTVSTALTEDQLSNSLQKSCYMPLPPNTGKMSCGDDDVKCSICQEEYAEGDEVGKLRCDHRYHFDCIHHWLQLKNWCPICKSHAAAAATATAP